MEAGGLSGWVRAVVVAGWSTRVFGEGCLSASRCGVEKVGLRVGGLLGSGVWCFAVEIGAEKCCAMWDGVR